MSPDHKSVSPGDTAAIVATMAAGDEQALGALYDAYGAVAYGLAYAITGTHARAEAAVASAFAEAWRSASTFDATRVTALGWVTSLVRKASIGAGPRGGPGTKRLASTEPGSLAAPPTAIGRALLGLTEQQRRVLELSYYGGLSVSEIAAELGEPERGTGELLRSAMNALRSALSPTGTFEDQAMTRA